MVDVTLNDIADNIIDINDDDFSQDDIDIDGSVSTSDDVTSVTDDTSVDVFTGFAVGLEDVKTEYSPDDIFSGFAAEDDIDEDIDEVISEDIDEDFPIKENDEPLNFDDNELDDTFDAEAENDRIYAEAINAGKHLFSYDLYTGDSDHDQEVFSQVQDQLLGLCGSYTEVRDRILEYMETHRPPAASQMAANYRYATAVVNAVDTMDDNGDTTFDEAYHQQRELMRNLDSLHCADGCIGGDNIVSGMGDKAINRAIGSVNGSKIRYELLDFINEKLATDPSKEDAPLKNDIAFICGYK